MILLAVLWWKTPHFAIGNQLTQFDRLQNRTVAERPTTHVVGCCNPRRLEKLFGSSNGIRAAEVISYLFVFVAKDGVLGRAAGTAHEIRYARNICSLVPEWLGGSDMHSENTLSLSRSIFHTPGAEISRRPSKLGKNYAGCGPLKIVPGWPPYIRMCRTDIAALFNQEQEIWSPAVDFVGGWKDKGCLGGKHLSPSFL